MKFERIRLFLLPLPTLAASVNLLKTSFRDPEEYFDPLGKLLRLLNLRKLLFGKLVQIPESLLAASGG